MSARVTIYQLQKKFVNHREDIPETARQVIYYTLAVGHHVGVLDCFSSLAEMPLEEYRAWVEGLPQGPGRSKLEGVLKWGEIEINASHVSELLPLLQDSGSNAGSASWVQPLVQCLKGMTQEPALYLMVRKYA
jgi:hypothetical protein